MNNTVIALTTPELPEIMSMTSEQFDDLAPSMVFDTTGWNYFSNFSKLSPRQRMTGRCKDCDKPVMRCKQNETLRYGAVQWQAYYKNLAPIEVNEETGEVIVKESTPKIKYKQAVDSDDQQGIKADYKGGLTLAEVAEKYNTAQLPVRNFLAEEGILRRKGERTVARVKVEKPLAEPKVRQPRVAPEGFGRKRTKFIVTEDNARLIKIELEAGQGGGMVAIAQRENYNPNELSVMLKGLGYLPKRGRQKVA